MESGLLHRKEYLILTSIDIIEELGLQGFTTREIAKRQNVSEATIFRHYKSKNELLLAVLNYYIQFDSDIFQSISLSNRKSIEAIQYYVMKHAEYYQNYPAITAFTQLYDVLRYDPELVGKVNEIQQSRTAMLISLIEDAQKAGDLQENLNSKLIAVMILGIIRENCLNWRLEKYSFSLRDEIKKSLDTFLNAFHRKS